ncbi:TPA_asm: alanine racemase [Salmonella enterica]|nr:alanine racemase [Salmonella enterica]
MSAIATSDTLCSGHGGFPPRLVAETVPWFTVNGKPVVVDGAMFPSHTDGNSAHPGSVVSTRAWYSIGGKGVVCVGDPLSCGSVIANGEDIFQVA